MDHLTLQVARLDDVRIDHPQRPHTGGRQVEQRRRPQPTGPHDQHPCGRQPLLTGPADLRKEHMRA